MFDLNPDWPAREVSADLRLRIARPMPSLSPALEAAVERHWRAALRQRPLFNGQVFCADLVTPDVIEGHWTEYRRVVAQIAEPALFGALRVRSLAVCGVLCGPDGVVAGRREARSVYQAGLWQLAPAGSVDGGAARGNEADWRAALLTELHEELGVDADAAEQLRPLCVVQHPSGVLDLGIQITTGLTAMAVLAAHRRAAHAEYDRLLIAPAREIERLVHAEGGELTPPALEFLRRLK